jgi:serine/threonine protein kinase
MSLTIGSRFGVFEVQSLLGVGGMGEVYLARDTRLGRDVALKVIPSAVAADRQRLDRFTREARALAALTHPAIGAIYDVAEDGETRALVLELVEGDTLDQRLQRGPLSIAEALTIARTVAEALDAAHDTVLDLVNQGWQFLFDLLADGRGCLEGIAVHTILILVQ